MRKRALSGFATVFLLCNLTVGQSRLMGDKFTVSLGNFPGDIGVIIDPADDERKEIDLGGAPVELTFDGIEEEAGGLLITERVVDFQGIPDGIHAEHFLLGEADLLDWELPGEVVEFSMRTKDGDWIANEIDAQSYYTIKGLDWANSDPGSEPSFVVNPDSPDQGNYLGFYFYYSDNGVPLEGYETLVNDALLVGPHPFDDNIKEVVYIGYSLGQVDEVADLYEGGLDITGGTSQLNENASWALLAEVLNLDVEEQDGFSFGFLVEPPSGPEIVFENGDTDQDGDIDVDDINALSAAVRDSVNEAQFDLNGDGNVNNEDRVMWVNVIKKTWFGDADLNGEFNTSDLVTVFQKGHYEDNESGNSNWETGDWNGDREFNTADFVTAFQAGGFEKGPRDQVAAVPEPSGGILVALGSILVFCRVKKRCIT